MDQEQTKPENQDLTESQEEIEETEQEVLPAGIARLHEEWKALGMMPATGKKAPRVELEPVVFPEPVGDYTVSAEEARMRLGLSEDAMDRLLASGELDSIQVRFPDGVKRVVSESALTRFIADAGMDMERAKDLSMPTPEVKTALEEIREQVQEIRESQTKQLQQFKDILLLELRNLKEQDRDLASFVYDLTEGLEDIFPKLKKRRRTTPDQGTGNRD
jgi:hypothetical protein